LRRGALAHGRALSLKIACDRGKEAASSPGATSWRRKRHAGGALGRRLVAGKAAKAPEACPVTERLGQRDIGNTILKWQARGLEHRQGRPRLLALRRPMERRKNLSRKRPIDQSAKLIEARLPRGSCAKPKIGSIGKAELLKASYIQRP
jgi:hypothetical protein